VILTLFVVDKVLLESLVLLMVIVVLIIYPYLEYPIVNGLNRIALLKPLLLSQCARNFWILVVETVPDTYRSNCTKNHLTNKESK
jgi:hypothetical protein